MNLATGETAEGWLGHSSLLAEMGTIQLEFRQLSHYTHDNKYAEAADHVSHLLEAMHPPHGLWPVYIDRSSGQFTGERLVTFGGMGDSMYEYLLKGWLQTGKKEEWLWEMYRKSMDGARERAGPVLSLFLRLRVLMRLSGFCRRPARAYIMDRYYENTVQCC